MLSSSSNEHLNKLNAYFKKRDDLLDSNNIPLPVLQMCQYCDLMKTPEDIAKTVRQKVDDALKYHDRYEKGRNNPIYLLNKSQRWFLKGRRSILKEEDITVLKYFKNFCENAFCELKIDEISEKEKSSTESPPEIIVYEIKQGKQHPNSEKVIYA